MEEYLTGVNNERISPELSGPNVGRVKDLNCICNSNGLCNAMITLGVAYANINK